MENYYVFWPSSLSSSSESDEEEVVGNMVLPELVYHRQKNENYVENIVANYSEEEFCEHFKLPRNTVLSLATEFEESDYFPRKETGNERISSWKCLLVFCWYATHEAVDFRDVSDRFDIAISTLRIIIDRVTLFISNKSAQIIRWPTIDKAVQIEEAFQEFGFPNVVGCLDGTHIRIDKPCEDTDSYINRNKYYSIPMQAACDNSRTIRDVFIGYPGSVHDARVFRTSEHTSLEVKWGYRIILADSAYPCLTNLMTPYRDTGHLTPVETNFNRRLSSCRIAIEHTFGILKQKFRQLYHLKLRNIETVCHFIACCVLHNMSIQNDVDNPFIEPPIVNDEVRNDQQENPAGNERRNYIASLLFNE